MKKRNYTIQKEKKSKPSSVVGIMCAKKSRQRFIIFITTLGFIESVKTCLLEYKYHSYSYCNRMLYSLCLQLILLFGQSEITLQLHQVGRWKALKERSNTSEKFLLINVRRTNPSHHIDIRKDRRWPKEN